MASADPAAIVAADSPLSESLSCPNIVKKENVTPVSSKIAELSESRMELLSKIQHLKQDLQNWRSRLDTQVKIYKDELSDLKESLNVEVDQLKSEFQELRTTLQQQQEDVAESLKKLGLGDVKEDDALSLNEEHRVDIAEVKALPEKPSEED